MSLLEFTNSKGITLKIDRPYLEKKMYLIDLKQQMIYMIQTLIYLLIDEMMDNI